MKYWVWIALVTGGLIVAGCATPSQQMKEPRKEGRYGAPPVKESQAHQPPTDPSRPAHERDSRAEQERKPDLRDIHFLSAVAGFRIDIAPKSEIMQNEPLVIAEVAGSRIDIAPKRIMQNDLEPEGITALQRGTEAAVVEKGYAVAPLPNAAVLRIVFLYPVPGSAPLRVAPDGKVLHSLPYNLKVFILRPDGVTAASHIYLGFVPVDFEAESSSPGQSPRMRMKPQWSGLEQMVKAHVSDFLGYVRGTKTE